MRGDSHALKRLRHIVACPHDIADLEAGSYFDVDADEAARGRKIEVIRTQTGITHGFVPLRIFLPLILSNRGDRIAGRSKVVGGDGEVEGIGIALTMRGEIG